MDLKSLFKSGASVWKFLRDSHTSWKPKVAVIAALLYVIIPVDLIADVPIVGWLDDIGVLALVTGYVLKEAGAEKRQ